METPRVLSELFRTPRVRKSPRSVLAAYNNSTALASGYVSPFIPFKPSNSPPAPPVPGSPTNTALPKSPPLPPLTPLPPLPITTALPLLPPAPPLPNSRLGRSGGVVVGETGQTLREVADPGLHSLGEVLTGAYGRGGTR
jgi:hypothetical protein